MESIHLVLSPSSSDNSAAILLGFRLDSPGRTAHYQELPLQLTRAEFELLEVLLESVGRPLTREHLCNRIQLRPFHPLGRSLDMLVSRLRRKLNVADNPGRHVRTVRGAGYMFEVPRAWDATGMIPSMPMQPATVLAPLSREAEPLAS